MNWSVKAEPGGICTVTVWQLSIFSGRERYDVERMACQAFGRFPDSKPSELVEPVEPKKAHSSSDTERSG